MGLQLGSRMAGLCIVVLMSGVLAAQGLPKEAQILIEENAKTLAEIKQSAEAQTKVANDQFRAQLEKLQTTYTKEGKLDEAVAIRDYLRSAATAGLKREAMYDPGTLSAYRSEVGRVLYVEVTGTSSGSLYGTDVYTHDSKLSAAAVHAGVLKLNETGIVKVTILPIQSSFKSTGRNGVSSSSWANTDYECYKVEPANTPDPASKPTATTTKPDAPAEVRADPGNLYYYRDQTGQSFLFNVTGATDGSVFGSDIYSDDSPLRVVVVHAGLLGVGKKGVVKVTINGPHDKFENTARNGITSRSWGYYGGSYKVEAVKEPASKLEAVKEAVKKVEGVKDVKDALNALEAVKGVLK